MGKASSNTSPVPWPAELDRYSRQMLFEPIGVEGQEKLAAAQVVVVGCGALGSAIAGTLARAGVGRLRIIDRDFIDRNNLQRQVLFSEDDIASGLPKAEAARRTLQRANSEICIEAAVTDLNHRNIDELLGDANLVLDGTDNFETRFLLNDWSVMHGRPWVYGACVGAVGMTMPFVPGETPCLRCIFEQSPPPEMSPTCDTAGIIAPVASIIAALQCTEALKLLTGRVDALDRCLVHIDLWQNRFSRLNVQKANEQSDCPCCVHRRFDYLDGTLSSSTTTLCGRNAVQVTPPPGLVIDFSAIAAKIRPVASDEPRFNPFMLKAGVEGVELTVFADGRAIIVGTDQPEQARSIYARYVGS